MHGRVILPCAVNLEMASGVLGGQELVHDHDVPRRQRPRKMRERAIRGCCSRWTAPRCRLECSRHLWCYHVASRARSGTRIPHFSRLLFIEVSLLPHAADCRAAVSRERARSTRGRDLSFEVNGRGSNLDGFKSRALSAGTAQRCTVRYLHATAFEFSQTGCAYAPCSGNVLLVGAGLAISALSATQVGVRCES